jgi:hypothetical protein
MKLDPDSVMVLLRYAELGEMTLLIVMSPTTVTALVLVATTTLTGLLIVSWMPAVPMLVDEPITTMT